MQKQRHSSPKTRSSASPLCLKYYLSEIEEQQQRTISTSFMDDQTAGEVRVGEHYLIAVISEYVLVELREEDRHCKEYLEQLLVRVEKRFSINESKFCKIVYKIFFYNDYDHLVGSFKEWLKVEVLKIREKVGTDRVISELPGRQFVKSPVDCETTYDKSKSFVETSMFETQLSWQQETRPARNLEDSLSVSTSLNNQDLRRKLNKFCDTASDLEEIRVYLRETGNPRSEMTEFCHYIGVDHPAITKTENSNGFIVTVRIDISGRHTKSTNTIYQESSKNISSKAATTQATQKLLLKIYSDHKELWENFKLSKASRKR